MPLVDFGFDANASEGRFTISFRCPIDREAEVLIVALFIAADPAQIEASARCGAQVVELHTGAFCDAAREGRAVDLPSD